MTAFDTAWAIVKMPFDPSSVKRLPDAQKPTILGSSDYYIAPDIRFSPMKRRWEAEFVHPKSGKRSMFDAYMSRGEPHEEGTWLSVQNREGSEAEGQAEVSYLDDDDIGHRWRSEGILVPESQRRSGIGSSMYDLIAHLIAGGSDSPAEKGRFLRDDEQSDEAYAMWERKNAGAGSWMSDNLERRWEDSV